MKTTVLIGLIIGNFLYQAFTGQNWERALDLSIIQAGALIAVGLTELAVANKPSRK